MSGTITTPPRKMQVAPCGEPLGWVERDRGSVWRLAEADRVLPQG